MTCPGLLVGPLTLSSGSDGTPIDVLILIGVLLQDACNTLFSRPSERRARNGFDWLIGHRDACGFIRRARRSALSPGLGTPGR